MQVISSKFFFCVWSICDDTMTHLSTLGDWWPLYTWDFGLSSWCAIVFCGLVYSCTELQHSILCVSPLAGNDITRKHLWKANNSQIPIPTPFSQSQSVQWTLSPLICKSPIYPPMVLSGAFVATKSTAKPDKDRRLQQDLVAMHVLEMYFTPILLRPGEFIAVVNDPWSRAQNRHHSKNVNA